MLQFGDLVEYKLRVPVSGMLPSSLPQRGIVQSIKLQSDNKTKTVTLNNGDRLVSTLHMVRRISMRTLDTNQVLWNPVPTWKHLAELHLEPTEYATDPSSNLAAADATGAMEGPANEMDSPDLIPVCPLHQSQEKRHLEKSKSCTRENRLRQKLISKSGQYVHWLEGDKRLGEIEELDDLYRECLTVREIQGFRKLVGISDKDTYDREKYNLKKRLKYKKQTWLPFRILQRVSFFPWLHRTKNNIESSSGQSTSNAQQAPIDGCADSGSTERDLLFTEKTIEFEDTVSALKVRFCSCCRENHIREVRTVACATKEYICSSCSKKDVEKDHYLRYNLQPIWYERVEGTSDHKNLKRDSEGNPIVRYDQPKELTSLTMAEQLLIRRCSPFIPAIHLHSGYMAIDGHGVAFEQKIEEMCNELPQTKASTLTFIREMGNKNTHDVHITSLRVRKQKVLNALRWLQLHHVDYHDIKIEPKNLDWMGASDEQYLRGQKFTMKVADKNEPKEAPFVSRVQCLINDANDADDIPFHMLGQSDGHRIPSAKQSKPILELVKSVPSKERHKLKLFPPHGDQPIK